MLGGYLHPPICRALLVGEVSQLCLCLGLDGFDMLYLDDPRYGVSYLCGFIEDVPIWEKALLDCEGSVTRSLLHS